MAQTEPTQEDKQAAELAAYSLRANGFTIEALVVDGSGVRITATRPSRGVRFLTKRGYHEVG